MSEWWVTCNNVNTIDETGAFLETGCFDGVSYTADPVNGEVTSES